jgi:hypothetical protein
MRRMLWACSTRNCFRRRWRRLAICIGCRTILARQLAREAAS